MPGAAPPPPMARPAAPMGRSAPPRREAEEERTRSTAIQAPWEDDELADLFEHAPAESTPSTIPPAPQQVARPKKKGLIGSALDALFGSGEKAETAKMPDAVRGRVVSRKGKEIVIDLEILEELDWDDAALAAVLARVWFDDGTHIHGKADLSKISSAA